MRGTPLIERQRVLTDLIRSTSKETADLHADAAADLVRQASASGFWTGVLEVASLMADRLGASARGLEFALASVESEIGLGRLDLARDRLEALISRISATTETADRLMPRAFNLLGYILWNLGDLDEAEVVLKRNYQNLLSRPDSAELGWAACNLGNVAWSRGDLAEARKRFVESMVSAERSNARRLRASAHRNLGLVHRQHCRWTLAAEHFKESLNDWTHLDDSAGRANVCRALAILEWKRGRLTTAKEASDLAVQIADEDSLPLIAAYVRQVLALIGIHRGEWQDSKTRLEAAREQAKQTRNVRCTLLASEFLGDVHLEQGQAAEALKHYDEVWPKAMALVPKGDIVAELRRRRAECYLLLGRNDEAYAAAKEGLEHCRELGDRYEEAATYRVLALSAAAVGRHDEARQHFTQGFAYYDDIETPYEWGKLWMAYGDWLLGSGAGPHEDRSAAREAYLAARDYFSNMGARAKLREAEARLKTLDAETPAPSADVEAATGPSSVIRRPQRRPASQSEVDRRSEGAWHDWYIITRHEPLLNILDRAAKLARSDVPILVTGETGTGKELVASGIHRASRLEGNYIPLNCAAVPKEMIESELFGHIRGAFSGAIAERQGLVEMAAQGTLFLDEVGEMSEAMQAKLLRFLESGEYRRVGEGIHRMAKTRLVAATNVSRERLERGEGFRNDLFWRLAQGCLEIPALRHRQGDVLLLVDHFLRLESRKMNKLSLAISEAARSELFAYAWPGNVRELVGVMRRAVALAEHTIEPEHLDLTSTREVAVTLTEEMAAAERVKLARAMKEHGDSPTAAARALGIPRTTLLMKLKRYGMR